MRRVTWARADSDFAACHVGRSVLVMGCVALEPAIARKQRACEASSALTQARSTATAILSSF